MLGCRYHHGSEYAGSRVGLVRGGRHRSRNRRRQIGDRHELDFAECRQAFASGFAELGCDYVDAPISGGEVGARNATLYIMCGGTEQAFARARQLFKVMGKNIAHAGAVGDGQTCKVVNQIIVTLNMQAVSEALVFAPKAGVDPGKGACGADGWLRLVQCT